MPAYSRRRETIVWIAGWPLWRQRARRRILSRAAVHVDDHAEVCAGLLIRDVGPLTVPRGCYLGPRMTIDTSGPIVLGENVGIGDNVSLVTGAHRIGAPDGRAGEHHAEGITIGTGTWIGSGAMVLPGVTIGPGCVVGAGAVVTSDLRAHGLYVGVPARHVRDLPLDAVSQEPPTTDGILV
ncbi:acyltransferase [Luteimicrobium subarcticum]|uniref:Maltose O-acetyltransferase n=1 Tax=Luteimicrobium subarcticum TaxID=620910 RepID=A0A2M8WT26_9MICO|nr:acyltransferase [Luteimicrobium subarcticum]PJI94112.1 maltose O-acetyltransferase [Luteimicrobium subarcticum]